jgi:hypothetical protein
MFIPHQLLLRLNIEWSSQEGDVERHGFIEIRLAETVHLDRMTANVNRSQKGNPA